MSYRRANRVLLIGWESVDWRMVRPLMKRGLLPALAALIDEGTSGNLATIQPSIMPMLWTSIATGKRADKHGICGFLKPTIDRTAIEPVGSSDRTCYAFWDILSLAGRSVHVTAWPASHPAEVVTGSIVSDRFPQAERLTSMDANFAAHTFYPANLETAFSALHVQATDLNIDELVSLFPVQVKDWLMQSGFVERLLRIVAHTSSVQAAACYQLNRYSNDVHAVFYSAVGDLSRELLHLSKTVREANVDYQRLTTHLAEGLCILLDRMLLNLVAIAKEDTTVLLVSTPSDPIIDLAYQETNRSRSTVYSRFGIACFQGPTIEKGKSLYGATLLDVTPTLLDVLGVSIGHDMDGQSKLLPVEDPHKSKWIDSWETHRSTIELERPSDTQRIDDAVALRFLMDSRRVHFASPHDLTATITQVDRTNQVNLAIALSDSNRLEQAITQWLKLVSIYPECSYYKIQLAICYQRSEQWAKCHETIAGLDEENRAVFQVRIMQAEAFVGSGNPLEAKKIVHELLECKPKRSSLFNRIGAVLLGLQEWRDAEIAFNNSLQVNSRDPVANDGLAQIYLELDNLPLAIEYARRAVSVVYHYPAAHFHLGSALHFSGEEEAAIAAFESCLAMGYEMTECHTRLAGLYLLRDPSRAKQHRELAGYQ